MIRIAFAVAISIMTSQTFGSIISHECLDRQKVFGTVTTISHGSAVEPTIAVNPKNKKHILPYIMQ